MHLSQIGNFSQPLAKFEKSHLMNVVKPIPGNLNSKLEFSRLNFVIASAIM